MTASSIDRGSGARFAVLGNLGGILFPIGALALLVVPGIWFYQAREWLDSGIWPSISVADGLRWAGMTLPQFSWAGAELASERFMSFPLSLVLLALIGGPLIAYARFSQWLERRCQPAFDEEQP